MIQESSPSVLHERPKGFYIDNDTGQRMFDDGHRQWPLIFNADVVMQEIRTNARKVNDEETLEEYREISQFLLKEENYSEEDFDQTAVTMVCTWLKSSLDHIKTDVYYELISEMVPENIFGVIKYDYRFDANSCTIYIMNDFSPKMYYTKFEPERQDELLDFGFFEEDFWGIMENEWDNVHAYFGGWNVGRRTNGEYRTLYKSKGILVMPHSLNMMSLKDDEETKYLAANESDYNYVSMNNIEEVYGIFDPETGLETIRDGSELITSRIRLFDYVEDYNFAAVLAFAHFKKFKSMYGDNPLFVFEKELDLPIDWYIKEDDVRFQIFKGKIYDNKLGAPIDQKHILNLLNMYNEREKAEKPSSNVVKLGREKEFCETI